MGGPRGGAVKIYRPSSLQLLVGWVCCAGFFLIGLVMVIGFFANAKSVGGVSGLVIGVICLVFSFWYGWGIHSYRLVASEGGLTFWDFYRPRHVSWESVAGFGAGRSDGMMGWAAVIVELDDGGRRRKVYLSCGVRRRAERFAGELGDALRAHREAAEGDGNGPGGETGDAGGESGGARG